MQLQHSIITIYKLINNLANIKLKLDKYSTTTQQIFNYNTANIQLKLAKYSTTTQQIFNYNTANNIFTITQQIFNYNTAYI